MPAGLDGNPIPVVTPARTGMLASIAALIVERRDQLDATRPLLVAIDGIDGAGKSTLADEVAQLLNDEGQPVIRSTIDWFHQPRRVRKRKGDRSALGFYEDSHDLAALNERLLDPLRAGAGHRYRIAAFDEPSDRPLDPAPIEVVGDEILVFDGIFLLRAELAGAWDLSIFVDGRRRVQLNRLGLVVDDVASNPTTDDVAIVDRVLTWVERIDRYASGMQIYLDAVDPAAVADLVVDNNDLANPRIVASR